jgi:iron complex transport system ATP-binding protein
MSYAGRDLRCSAGNRVLLDGVSLEVLPRQVHALLGPNGAGKTSLLRLLSGERRPDSGRVTLNGRPLDALDSAARARQRAVLPQSHGLSFGFTAAQVVALGRLSCPRHAAEREARIVQETMELAGVAHLAGRIYPTLSGGERARVQLARVMAQVWDPLPEDPPRYLLLDEPTASLDLAHQHDCLRALRTLATRDIGVLVILHDPNLALRHAGHITLLREGRVLAQGHPAHVITEANLEQLYGVPVRLVRAEGEPLPVVTVRDADPPSLSSGAAPARSAP